MRVGNITKAIAVAASVAWIAGCSSTSTTSDSSLSAAEQAAGASTQPVDVGSAVTTGGGADSGSMASSGSAGSLSDAGGMAPVKPMIDLSQLANVFYFDFDRAVIDSSLFADLNGHAEYIISNPSARVVLEGHADERGTREYNLALGERRAKAVQQYLQLQGVPGSQLEVVSYGEERPLAMGHAESFWSKNRRVEIKY